MIISNFRWKNWEPQLIFRENEEEKHMPIMNQDLNLKIGGKFCIGYSKSGKYRHCPDSNEIDSGRQCSICKSLDENLPCVQCMGLCTNMKQRKRCMSDSYSIYLASFGSLIKVGITQEFRLKQRLVEQGADFGAKITTLQDGRMIRVYEQRIKRYLGITDRVLGTQKHSHLFSDPKECIKGINGSIKKLNLSPLKEIMRDPEIFDMRSYYNLIDVKPSFETVEKGLEINGRVICVKGNMIVIENGSHKCIDGHALIGREIVN
jgi:hypothetical protein